MVFPPKSRQNPGKAPVCYLYRMGHPGTTWKIDAKLVWKAELPVMPLEAVVSMDGTLVTLDADADSGTDHAVVVYDGRGHVVRSWKLDDLVPRDDAAKLEQSKSSPHWTQGAKYYFIRDKLYIALAFGKTIEIALKDGRIKYGVAMPAVDNNAEAEVWRTSLRFSSITDVVAKTTK